MFLRRGAPPSSCPPSPSPSRAHDLRARANGGCPAGSSRRSLPPSAPLNTAFISSSHTTTRTNTHSPFPSSLHHPPLPCCSLSLSLSFSSGDEPRLAWPPGVEKASSGDTTDLSIAPPPPPPPPPPSSLRSPPLAPSLRPRPISGGLSPSRTPPAGSFHRAPSCASPLPCPCPIPPKPHCFAFFTSSLLSSAPQNNQPTKSQRRFDCLFLLLFFGASSAPPPYPGPALPLFFGAARAGSITFAQHSFPPSTILLSPS